MAMENTVSNSFLANFDTCLSIAKSNFDCCLSGMMRLNSNSINFLG